MSPHRVGDLVHIPQSVELIDCEPGPGELQLTIPLEVRVTQVPTIAVVTKCSPQGGYSRVLVNGRTWRVRNDSIYLLKGSG